MRASTKRATIQTSLTLALMGLTACVTVTSDYPGEDFELEESGQAPTPKKKSEDSDENSKSSSKDSKEESEDKSPKNKRDCDDIQWGSSLKKGEVVRLGNTKGFVDSDGDGRVEREESEVGMCQLYETGKKCGLVIAARKGCPFCPAEFQRMAELLPKLKKADLAIYLHFTEEELEAGADTLSSEKYLGAEYFHALSNEDSIGMRYAPRKALVDLRTMQVVALEQPFGKKLSVQELLDQCNSLK